ncbi:BA14K family protein [Mesorhizobium sp. M0571]|uniref:BA14K family protein n=1 Tax=Mesorhizobium sp. M0571 TaxID=2956960 RepID=UPI00333ACF71
MILAHPFHLRKITRPLRRRYNLKYQNLCRLNTFVPSLNRFARNISKAGFSYTLKKPTLMEFIMRKSTLILTTIALGAVLAIGSVSESMARGGGGGHGVGFGGGDHGFGDRGFGRGYGGVGGWWDDWGPDYYPYYGNYAANDDANVTSCEARYHSYNPATGTYLGYDGHRHYCSRH